VQGTQTTNYTPDPRVAGAAYGALDSAQKLQDQGYQAYGGNRVADFSQLQEAGFGQAANAVSSQNPFYQTSADLIGSYATTPGQSVTPNSIASQMSPYMNQYVSQALAPQIQAQNQQFAAQDRNLNAQATASGAFGDARAGIEAANLTQNQDIARSGLIGNAYTNAFNTAIGAGAQDVGNQMQGGMFNAQMQQAGLGRQLTGAQALQQLYGTNLANLANQYGLSAQAGGAQQQQAQARLNVPYSDYLAAQQWPFMTQQMMNQTIGTAGGVFKPSETQTKSAPDNSGWATLGSVGAAMFLSDKRAKKDIEEIGQLKDGQKIYRYRFKDDPTNAVHVGLIAQDVEKHHPGAVVQFRGKKFVDHDRATALSANMGDPEFKMAA
jgi:hypothetical protein